MEVPTILDKNGNPTAKNDFITAKIINSYLGMLAAKKEAQEKYDKVIEEIKRTDRTYYGCGICPIILSRK